MIYIRSNCGNGLTKDFNLRFNKQDYFLHKFCNTQNTLSLIQSDFGYIEKTRKSGDFTIEQVRKRPGRQIFISFVARVRDI